MVEEFDEKIWKHAVGSYSYHFQLIVNDSSNKIKNSSLSLFPLSPLCFSSGSVISAFCYYKYKEEGRKKEWRCSWITSVATADSRSLPSKIIHRWNLFINGSLCWCFFLSHAFIVEFLSKYKQGIFLHITTVTKYKMENYRGYIISL